MKGVILAGGLGTRLRPLTDITNKHLLPVYDKPMILYSLETLKRAGLKEIMIVCGKEHAGHFMNFLGSGKDCGVKLSYSLQHGSGGIAEALSYAEDFSDGGRIAVILGDNLYEDDFREPVERFKDMDGAMVFVKEADYPERFGVAEIRGDRIIAIEEKPDHPKSRCVITGLYLYGGDVFEKIKTLEPSSRGELEITDVNNLYLRENRLSFERVQGFWSDAGTFSSLLKSAEWAARHNNASGIKT